MAPESPNSAPRPTLDDLLRYKRAERPPPEFWDGFERGLRQKQLAALIRQPSGWMRLRAVGVRSMRWAMPAAAMAAVAVVIFQTAHTDPARNAPIEVASRPVVDFPEQPVLSVALTAPRVEVQPVAPSAPVVVAIAQSAPVSEPSEVRPADTPQPSSSSTAVVVESVVPVVVAAAPAVHRPRSSWTSRYESISQDLTGQGSQVRHVQLASMNLRGDALAGRSYAGSSLASGRDAIDERRLRAIESRMDATGSSLSIKF